MQAYMLYDLDVLFRDLAALFIRRARKLMHAMLKDSIALLLFVRLFIPVRIVCYLYCYYLIRIL